jgi:hypothetical protein
VAHLFLSLENLDMLSTHQGTVDTSNEQVNRLLLHPRDYELPAGLGFQTTENTGVHE